MRKEKKRKEGKEKRRKKKEKRGKKEKKRNYFCFSTIQNRATQ